MTKEEMKKEKEFKAKYDAVIRQIAVAEECDMGVAYAMFTYELRVRLGIQKKAETYKGIPESFNFDEAMADYKKLIEK